MPPERLTLRPATVEDLPAVAEVFLASRRAAVPAMPPVDDEVDARRWVRSWDLSSREVWLAEEDDRPVGFAGLEHAWLSDLYVDPAHAGSGVGSALLDVVKAQRPDGFALWVFETNAAARAFYARHGLVELDHTDGSDNRERSPDLRMAWPGRDPLAYLRRQIDEVDHDLAGLLGRRAALTAAVQDHKAATGTAGHAARDPERERQIAERMSAHAPGLDADALARVVRVVIEVSLDAWERRTGPSGR